MDKIISLLTVLLIMSVITEKVTFLIRKYPNQSRILSLLLAIYGIIVLSVHWCRTDLNTGAIVLIILIIFGLITISVFTFSGIWLYHHKDDEPISHNKSFNIQRTNPLASLSPLPSNDTPARLSREVGLLSFLVGLIIAIIFNSNIFDLLTVEKLSHHDFGPINEPKFIGPILLLNADSISFKALIGFVITGFFLSFGSKFFHDLLDNLLQIKNLKRKLNDKETYNIQSIEEFDEYLKVTQLELTRKAIEQNLDWAKALPNYHNLSLSAEVINGQTTSIALLELKTNDTSRINSDKLNVRLGSGKTYHVPLRIYTDVDDPVAQVKAGDLIGIEEFFANYKGTVCCPVIDQANDIFLLTCAHVLTGGFFKPDLMRGELTPAIDNVVNDNDTLIGSCVYGFQNRYYDIAVVKPKGDVLPNISPSGLSPEALPLNDNDLLKTIKMNGALSGMQSGVITGINEKTDILFAGDKVQMEGLVKIGRQVGGQYRPLSQAGDSGAIVTDNFNNPVGMVVAGNKYFTYLIPLEYVFGSLNLKTY